MYSCNVDANGRQGYGYGMRRLAMLGVISLISSCVGQVPTSFSDPLFGVQYDTQRIHFESVPSAIMQHCSDLRQRYIRAWIYGHTKTADTEYFIVSGFMRYEDETSGSKKEVVRDENGLIVAVHGGSCEASVQDGFYWDENPPILKLSKETKRELARDSVQRYVKAFGGKDAFLKRVGNVQEVAPELLQQIQALKGAR
jgi:hypothetical protein